MLNWFAERWNDLLNLFLSLALTLWDMFNDLVCSILDSVFSFIVTLFNSLGAALSTFNITNYTSAFPDELINMMALLGVNDVSKIIISALIIRFTLRLIPFIRLGG